MKSIVYLTGSLHVRGGISRILSLKANYLAERGYEVTILMLHDGLDTTPAFPLSDKVKLVVLEVDYYRTIKNKRNLIGVLRGMMQRLQEHRRFIRQVRDYLLHYHTDVVFTTVNDTRICRIGDGSRKVHELHFSIENQRRFMASLSPVPRLIYRLYNDYQQRSMRCYDRVVLLTERDRELRGDKLANVTVIPNFITIQPPQSLPDYSAHRVLALGRYDAPKGYDRLIAAWARVNKLHPDWQLHIYGQSYGRLPDFQRQVDELGLQGAVCLHEAVSDVEPLFLSASFYVMSSRNEGFPLVLPEAMACGLACVAYDCNCGPADIIIDGEDGLLVRPVEDVERLAEAIDYMIAHPDRREEMGRAARRNIRRFDVAPVMQRWIDLIENRG